MTAGWRKAERTRLIAARLAMPDAERAAASAAIDTALAARLPAEAAGLVAGYWPIRGEVDPLPHLRRIIGAGGAVALPVVTSPGAPLSFRRWTPGMAMEAGRWDILHPAAGPEVTPEVLLIPLVGFDGASHRLGYGGGYYDRTLAAMIHRPLTIGLGFELGRLGGFQPEAHDMPLDVIITEAGDFAGRGRT